MWTGRGAVPVLEEQRECGKSPGPGRPAKDPLLAGPDQAMSGRRKEPDENARNHRSERWVRNTTRNGTAVPFTTLKPIAPQDSEPLRKRSA